MEPTIRVKNKKTGQVFEGTISEARKFGFSDEFIVKKLKSQAELNKAQKTIAEGGDILAPEQTATQQKEVKSFDATLNLINTLEEQFQKAGGGEYLGTGARVAGLKKSLSGKLGLNDEAKTYDDTRKGFVATLRSLTGDVGVLTEEDYKRISNLLPTLGATPGEAKEKFNTLRSQVSAKYGQGASQTGIKPEVKGGLAAATFPGVTELYKSTKKESLPVQALETVFPVTQLRKPEGRQAASEVLSTLGVVDLAKSGLNFVKGGGPVGRAGEKRLLAGAEAESTGAKISNDEVLSKVQEKIMKSNLTDSKKKKALEIAEAQLKKGGSMTPTESIGEFSGATAYTKGGAALRSAEGQYSLAVRESLKEIWARDYPELLKQTKNIARLYGVGKDAKKLAQYGGMAAMGLGGATYIYNFLRGKNQ